MDGDSKYEKYPNFEEYMKDYFGGLYVPSLKTCLKKEKYESLLNLAERCTRDSSLLIQGYHFNNDLSMRCFIRAVMYGIYDNFIKPLPFVNSYKIVEEYFHNEPVLDRYVFPPILFISYGLHEPNHSSIFDLTNKISEMRKHEDKRTFILSLKSTKDIREQQEKQNLLNLQNGKNQKPIKEFCVQLITIDELTIHDTKGITRLWEGDSILQPEIIEEVDFCFAFDGIEIDEEFTSIKTLPYSELPCRHEPDIENLIE